MEEQLAKEAESCGTSADAEGLWKNLLERLSDSETQALLFGRCFAGLGKIALANGRPREGLAFLEKASAIFQSCDDEARAADAKHHARQCRAATGELLNVGMEFDMVQFALRLAQFELAQKHFRHCRVALDCADALNEDPYFADAVDKVRRKLAKASGAPVDATASVTEAQALDFLAAIQREDMGSIWRRSWTPYMVTLGMGITVAGILYFMHSPTPKEE